MSDLISFNRADLPPLALLQESWERLRGHYWLFLGIVVVGVLISGAVPMGILTGPMMCGIYLCYRARARGIPFGFDLLFKGFDRFVESFIAALLMMAAALVVVVPLMGLLAMVFLLSIGGLASANHPPVGAVLGLLPLVIGAVLLVVLASMLVGLLFTFTFPLLADRDISGVEAVKLSVRAALAHFWGLLVLGLATFCLSLAGLCFCYVGTFLVLPITFGVHWLAYERVFGLSAAD